MARRDYGSGSVYQRADGRWIGALSVGSVGGGARKRVTVSAKTEAECKKKMRDRQRLIDREGVPTQATMTVARYAEEWLEARRTVVRAKPWATDASAVRRWITPTIGRRRLEQLTPTDVRAVVKAQREAGLSSSTARRNHMTLTSMLRAAMLDGHQVPHRVLLVEAPVTAPNDLQAMPDEQLDAVLAVAAEHLPHWSRWLVQMLYGQRPAELLGLTWSALDFDAKRIRIEWQLQALPYRDRADRSLGFVVPDGMRVRHLVDAWHLTPPKTKKGLRVVPMLPVVEAALLAWRDVAGPSPHDLVWPTAAGRPANEKHDLEEWKALQGSAEVGHPSGRYWRIYEARHAFATRLLEGGIDEKTMAELMGHSSVTTTHGYQHVRLERSLEALVAVNGRIAQGLPLTRGLPDAGAGTPALPGAASQGAP